MKVVVDTNVLISGVFFGGAPRRVVEAVAGRQIEASATPEIMEEYDRVVREMVRRGQGRLRTDALSVLLSRIRIDEPATTVAVCRDPDDDKFIACAIDAGALYVVSGDRDLLDLGSYEGVDMITAADFCDRYLTEKGSTP